MTLVRARPREAKTVDQLPVNPLKMPPPYWRSGGASMHAVGALEDLTIELLPNLGGLIDVTSEKLKPHFEKYPKVRGAKSEEALQEFMDIAEELYRAEDKIVLKCELVNLMTAILIEETVNMLCVFNLSRDVVEPIEKLAPASKLAIAARILNRRVRKDDAGMQGLNDLMQWRNAFAHGHCVDRPTKTLRHNHLIMPEDRFRTLPKSIGGMLKLLAGFAKADALIRRCSINKYVRGRSAETTAIAAMSQEIARYKFSGTGVLYAVKYES